MLNYTEVSFDIHQGKSVTELCPPIQSRSPSK